MASRHGDIHWSELMTNEPEKAVAFYEKTAGWVFQTMQAVPGADYHVAMKDGQPVAGVFPMADPEWEGMPNHWMTYIAVDDVDTTCAAAVEAGGKVTRAPFDVPTVGRIAILEDATGACIGMMTPATSAP